MPIHHYSTSKIELKIAVREIMQSKNLAAICKLIRIVKLTPGNHHIAKVFSAGLLVDSVAMCITPVNYRNKLYNDLSAYLTEQVRLSNV